MKVDDEGKTLVYLRYYLVIVYLLLSYLLIFSLSAELKRMESDPTYNINVTGDIKQMLQELGTEKGKEIAQHGGGGNKARDERAAALAAILAARSRIKEDSNVNGESTRNAYSIVDAASASVHGRSANAAKSASSDKTVARIALHMAGERTPVNAKLVSIS